MASKSGRIVISDESSTLDQKNPKNPAVSKRKLKTKRKKGSRKAPNDITKGPNQPAASSKELTHNKCIDPHNDFKLDLNDIDIDIDMIKKERSSEHDQNKCIEAQQASWNACLLLDPYDPFPSPEQIKDPSSPECSDPELDEELTLLDFPQKLYRSSPRSSTLLPFMEESALQKLCSIMEDFSEADIDG